MAKKKLEPKISISASPEEAVLHDGGSKRFLIDDVPDGEELPSEGGASYFVVGILAVFCFLLAAGSGFMYLRLNQAEAVLASSQERMVRVESKLQITDASMLEASDKAGDRFKELEFEIRKLWDNVWKKAKTQLADHDARIKAVSASQASTDKTAKANADALAQITTAQQALSSKLDDQQQALSKRLAALEADLASQQGELNVRLSELESGLADVEKRLVETEEWIKSTNAFRRQVIKDLRYLRKTVRELQGDASTNSEGQTAQ